MLSVFLRLKLHKNLFGELTPEEVPTPYQQMHDKFDPITHNEMFVLVRTTYWYAISLLEKAGYSEETAKNVAYTLARTEYVHSHSILSEEAKEIGFNIQKDDALMDLYRELVAVRLKEKSVTHCIDSFFPEDNVKIELGELESVKIDEVKEQKI